MKIGILGAKVIGSTLGRGWASAGHEVKFGVRNQANPEVISLVQSMGSKASVGSVAEAIQFGDVVVFAIPGKAVDETVAAHKALLNGKTIIDAANRMGEARMNSLETFRAAAPQAKMIRAFNNLGYENFANPVIGGVQVDLIYCADAGEAAASAAQLIADLKLNPVYVGDMSQTSVVDNIASLWFALAFGQKMGRNIAFKVLRP